MRSRTAQLLTIHALFEQYTGRSVKTNELKRWTSKSIAEQVGDPQVALAATAMLRVVNVLTTEVRHLEKEVVGHVKLREEFQLLRTPAALARPLR